MDDAELNALRQYAATMAHQLAVETVVSYDKGSGFMTVEAISRAGGGEPRSVKRSMKFQSRERAEKLIEQVIRTAAAH